MQLTLEWSCSPCFFAGTHGDSDLLSVSGAGAKIVQSGFEQSVSNRQRIRVLFSSALLAAEACVRQGTEHSWDCDRVQGAWDV